MNNIRWTPARAFAQLESCRYQCEGGSLEANEAYKWLKSQVAAQEPAMPERAAQIAQLNAAKKQGHRDSAVQHVNELLALLREKA